MTYKVLIEETVSQMFEIEADNLDEAREKVNKDYRDGEIVLEPGDLENAQFTIFDSEGVRNLTEWEKIF